MAKLDLLIQAWDEGHREFAIALEGLSDEELWKRAHPKLLSVGELGGHIAYWEANMGMGDFTADIPEKITGPLVADGFRYYTTEVDQPVALGMGVDELLKEVSRVHEEAKKIITDLDPDATDLIPGTQVPWGFYLKYRGFHIAYHTGQAYSVRHLLGHTPTDN